MGKKVIERLYNTMEKRICLRGQVLARQGKPCDKLVIIYDGEFEK